jgi:hypothetical protein
MHHLLAAARHHLSPLTPSKPAKSTTSYSSSCTGPPHGKPSAATAAVLLHEPSPMTAAIHRPSAKPMSPQAPHGFTVHPRPEVHRRWPSVRAAEEFPLLPPCATIARSLWWAFSPSKPPIRFPSAPTCSPTRPPLAAHRWLTRFYRSTVGSAMGAHPPPLLSIWPWAKRPKWAETLSRPGLSATMGLAQFNSAPFLFRFKLIWIIPKYIQTSEICSNSNKFDKNINSILLFEFKYIL